MKAKFTASITAPLFFYLSLFAVQSVFFFFAPSFYVASIKQTEIPSFIKFSFLKLYGLALLLMILWALLLGFSNFALFRKGKALLSHPFRFFFLLTLAQFSLLFLALSYRYPSILGFFPRVSETPLLHSYLFLLAMTLAAGLLAFIQLRPFNPGRTALLLLAVLWPLGLHIGLLRSDSLHLPKVNSTSPSGKDVLLISFDALDGDSANKTMEEAARELGGRIFSNAFTPLPATHPSWNSILSGLYPEGHGVRLFFESPLKPSHPEIFLQRLLKNKGNYYNLFASDLPETSSFTPEKGFEESIIPQIGWEAHLHATLLNHFIFPAIWLNNGWVEALLKRSINSPALFNYDLPRFFNFTFSKLEKTPAPLKLLALHSCHLHTPIQLQQPELSQIPDYLSLAPNDFSYWKWPKPGDPLQQTPENWMNPYFIRRPHTLRFIQELISELEENGYFKSKLVVFLSDHGERFFKGHEIYGGVHGFDLKTREQSNVALAFFDAQWKEIKIIPDPVSLIDVAPTILSLLAYDIQDHPYDGLALFDSQGNARTPPKRPIYTESMGFIEEAKGEGDFPRISVTKLESSLTYHPNGRVQINPSYYELILKNKEFVDLSTQGSILGTALNP